MVVNGRPTGQIPQGSRPPVSRPPSLPANSNAGPQTPYLARGPNFLQQAKPIASGSNGATNLQRPPQAAPPHNGHYRPQGAQSVQPAGPPIVAPRPGVSGQTFHGQVPANILRQGSTPPRNNPGSVEHEPPVGFFPARVAETLQSTNVLPVNAPLFDPHQESPSIRKTAGVDHTRSKQVG